MDWKFCYNIVGLLDQTFYCNIVGLLDQKFCYNIVGLLDHVGRKDINQKKCRI